LTVDTLVLMGNQDGDAYSGSIRAVCRSCGGKTWLGPRQQEVRAQHPEMIVLCWPCAVNAMRDPGAAEIAFVAHLGNPEGVRQR
jgi:hypothetical protein